MQKLSGILVLFILSVFLTSCNHTTSAEVSSTETAIVLHPTQGFQWDVIDESAYLTGIGNVVEADIVIPDQVSLIKVEESWIESNSDGSVLYPVVVAGDAFFDCAQLRTVTFMEDVAVQSNRMYRSSRGMFAGCSSLISVYNIPDSVTDMTGTFSNCSALKEISNFPDTLGTLSNCFTACSALETVPTIPNTVRNMYKAFFGCTTLTTIPNFPASLTDLRECFAQCSAFVSAPAIAVDNVSMDGAFLGCTSLTEAPTLPNGVTSLTETFKDCTALQVAPIIPESVRSMFMTFSNCTALEIPPEIPSSVEQMTACFEYCTSLKYPPALPDSLTQAMNCFLGCVNMTGEIVITKTLLKDYGYAGIIGSCSSSITLYVETCPFDAAHNNFVNFCGMPVPTATKIKFLKTHPSGSMCGYCHTLTKYGVTDDIYVIFDNIPEIHCNWLMDYLDNQVPDFFKAYTNRVTLTDDIDNHLAPDDPYRGRLRGFALYPEICLEFPTYSGPLSNASKNILCYMLYHELGHNLDSGYGLLSQQDDWHLLHEKEGTTASYWYGSLYQEYDDYQRHQETFAISVGKYFTDPNALKASCPGMYEYMDVLFRNISNQENVA